MHGFTIQFFLLCKRIGIVHFTFVLIFKRRGFSYVKSFYFSKLMYLCVASSSALRQSKIPRMHLLSKLFAGKIFLSWKMKTRSVFYFFSVRERAVFYKSCDLIGSGSGRYSPIRPARSGRYPMRVESSITSLTSLQFFINYIDTYHVNL